MLTKADLERRFKILSKEKRPVTNWKYTTVAG